MTEPTITLNDVECPTARGQIKGLLEDLIQLCPSDATFRATLSKIKGKFTGEIRVVSSSGLMWAHDQASGAAEVVDHIRTQLLNQIRIWREHRFAA